MNKILKVFVILGTFFLLCFGIYKTIQIQEWKEENCDIEYYERTVRVCAKSRLQPQPMGKTVGLIRRCVEYKDTVVTMWRYKCPPKTD
jgi:hypothetical protein